MRPTRRSLWFARLILAIAGGALAGTAAASEFVVVSATAAPEYRRTKGPDGIMAESYVFSPGLYFGGAVRDKTQERLPFLTMARTLATVLTRQRYFPATEPAKANLVIVVHWGSTETFEDPLRQQEIEQLNKSLEVFFPKTGGEPPLSDRVNAAKEINDVLSAQEATAARQQQYTNASAELLGYERSLKREGQRLASSEEEITMRSELAEERYFVVLMAYDYQLLQREKKSKLLWVTRMSVRSPGTNFAEAVPGMARIAADFFGQPHDDLARVATKLREGQVEIGELKVVEPVVETLAPAKAAK